MQKVSKGLAQQLRVLFHGCNRLRSGFRNAYKGDGKCTIDAQKTKGPTIAQKTGFI